MAVGPRVVAEVGIDLSVPGGPQSVDTPLGLVWVKYVVIGQFRDDNSRYQSQHTGDPSQSPSPYRWCRASAW